MLYIYTPSIGKIVYKERKADITLEVLTSDYKLAHKNSDYELEDIQYAMSNTYVNRLSQPGHNTSHRGNAMTAVESQQGKAKNGIYVMSVVGKATCAGTVPATRT